MKYFFLIIFLMTVLIYSSQSKVLKIETDLSDCLNCNLGMHSLKFIDSTTRKIFLVKENEKTFFNEYIKQYGITGAYKIETIKAQTKKNKRGTYCFFYLNNTLADTFSIKILPTKTNELNSINTSEQKMIGLVELKDSLILSNRINVIFNQGTWTATDYLLNKTVCLKFDRFLQKEGDRIVIESKSFPARPFLKFNFADTVTYKKELYTLKYLGKHFPHIENAFATDTSLTLLITFSYPVAGAGDALSIMSKLFLYERNLRTSKRNLIYIKEEDLKPLTGKKLFLDNLMPFFKIRDGYRFSIFDPYTFSKREFLADYFVDEDTLKYKGKTYSCGIDSLFYNKNAKRIESSNCSLNQRYYYFNSFPLIFDLKMDKKYLLDGIKNDTTSYILDVIGDEAYAKVLTKNSKGFKVFVYDVKTNKIIFEKHVTLPEDINEYSIKFNSINSVFGLDKKGKQFRIYSI